jgi:hypothetical protein
MYIYIGWRVCVTVLCGMTASTTAKEPVPDLRHYHYLRSLSRSCTIVTSNNIIPCRFILITGYTTAFFTCYQNEPTIKSRYFDCDTHLKLIGRYDI